MNRIAVAYTYSSGIYFPKITLHVFVCDSGKYMEFNLRIISFRLHEIMLSVNSPALILSKNSGVFLAKIG